MFKYELNQLIYYLKDNKVHSSKVLSRKCIENALERDDNFTEFQKNFYMRFGESQKIYATVHGEIPENLAFATKYDLLKSL